MSNTVKKSPIPKPANPAHHQPTKAELEEEIDMPGMSMEQVREAFLQPAREKGED